MGGGKVHNMKYNGFIPRYGGDIYNKVDVIMHGMETIGSAERSSDPKEMRKQFHTISDGMYAELLYGRFGKNRVEEELEEFLSYNFISRVGGGIGLTRLISAFNKGTVNQFTQKTANAFV